MNYPVPLQWEEPSAASPSPGARLAARPRLRVLLAEDTFITQKLTARILEKRGHTVTVVSDGKAAFAQVMAGGHDVVLMDVQMPEMDGMEATRLIREEEQKTGGHVPIVAMTAHALVSYQEGCRAAGMDDYISKPMHGDDLLTVLYRCVDRFSKGKGPSAVPLDLALLVESTGGDRQLLGELVRDFVSFCPAAIVVMREAVRSGNGKALQEQAHRCQGMLENFLANQAKALTMELEAAATAGETARLSTVVDALEREFEAIRGYLGAYAPVKDAA